MRAAIPPVVKTTGFLAAIFIEKDNHTLHDTTYAKIIDSRM